MKFGTIKLVFGLLLMWSIAHSQQPEWQGNYLFSLKTEDQLDLQFYMELTPSKGGFEGHSREGAANEIFGNWNTFLAKLFTSNFKKGSLLRLTDGVVQKRNDSTFLNAVLNSAMGDFHFNATYLNGQLSGELLSSRQEHYATISASKHELRSLRNYARLTDSILKITRARIYRPALTNQEEYLEFSQNLQEITPYFKDDAELFFSFFYYKRNLPFSHYFLLRDVSKRDQSTSLPAHSDLPPQASLSTLHAGDKEVAYLAVNSFSGTAAEIDSLFGVISNKAYHHLIIDLRKNPGGTLEPGLALASHLVEEPTYGGVFLSNKWFATHNNPPSIDEYHKLPVFSTNDFQLFMKGIHEKEGLALKVQPSTTPYTGDLYILTDKQTASTSEPIVKAFKHYGRATIVGENTAGTMLSMEPFSLPENYVIYIPTAGYYAPDGSFIDQTGVKPHIEVKSAAALEKALELIQQN